MAKKKEEKLILTGYRAQGIELYNPKVNRRKQFGLLGLAIGCFITPGTNWILPITAKLITKFNPLWIYQ